MAQVTFEPISLGPLCDTKYQISRVAYERQGPPDGAPFSAHKLAGGGYGQRFPTHLFDAPAMPHWALAYWLRRNFQGVFEREDFVVDRNEAYNRKFNTRHPHEFVRTGTSEEAVRTDADLDELYPFARRRFDYLVDKFQKRMAQPEPILFVRREARPEEEIRELVDLLSAAGPAPFHLLVLDWEDCRVDLAGVAKVSTAWLPRNIGKPPERDWEGNDAAWDAALAPFSFTRPIAAAALA